MKIEAIGVSGTALLWLDEPCKEKDLATNLLATKIAHRPNAGLYTDGTINGRALIVGLTKDATSGLGSSQPRHRRRITFRNVAVVTSASRRWRRGLPCRKSSS